MIQIIDQKLEEFHRTIKKSPSHEVSSGFEDSDEVLVEYHIPVAVDV